VQRLEPQDELASFLPHPAKAALRITALRVVSPAILTHRQGPRDAADGLQHWNAILDKKNEYNLPEYNKTT
jgi:hypothetical protein